MRTSLQVHHHASAEELDVALARFVATRLSEALIAWGEASLVVSGGRTPTGFFQQLAQQPLDWSGISITLADERWVDESDEQSNARLVRQHLLQGPAAAARFIPLYHPAATPQDSADAACTALDTLDDAFDVVVLGMGDDGHTASLFPGSPQLDAALHDTGKPCLAVEASKPPRDRLTLTAARLRHAHHIVLHVTGQTKWQVLGTALASGPMTEYPVRALIQHEHPSRHVFWTA